MLRDFLISFLFVSLWGSVCTLLLCVFLPRLRRRYRARTLCAVWLVIALRLLIPVHLSLPNAPVRIPVPPVGQTAQAVVLPQPAPQSPLPQVQPPAVQQAPAEQQSPVEQQTRPQPITPQTEEKAPHTPAFSLTPQLALVFLWAAGAAAHLIWYMGSYLVWRRRLLAGARPVDGDIRFLWQRCCKLLDLSRPVPALESALVRTPMIVGALRPVLAVPVGMQPEEGTVMILLHEGSHAKRQDIWAKLLLQAAVCLHWFNPVVRLLRAQAQQEIELACDQAVVSLCGETSRPAYAKTLLRQAAGPALVGCSQFGSGKKALKGRLTGLYRGGAKKGTAWLLVCALAVGLGGSLVACRQGADLQYSFTPVELEEGVTIHGLPMAARPTDGLGAAGAAPEGGWYIAQKEGLFGLLDLDGLWVAAPEWENIRYGYDYCLTDESTAGKGVWRLDAAGRLLEYTPGAPGLIGTGHPSYGYDALTGRILQGGGVDNTAFWVENPPAGPYVVLSGEVQDGGFFDDRYLEKSETPRLALFAGTEALTGFDYSRICQQSGGLFAACRDGKWGYLNEKGETVIPFEFDPIRTDDVGQKARIRRLEETGTLTAVEAEKWMTDWQNAFAAAPCREGFVPLCKDGEYALYTAAGEQAIPFGEFEVITEPYNGRCWAKKEGVWGVLCLGETHVNVAMPVQLAGFDRFVEGGAEKGDELYRWDLTDRGRAELAAVLQPQNWQKTPESELTGMGFSAAITLKNAAGHRLYVAPISEQVTRIKLEMPAGGNMNTHESFYYTAPAQVAQAAAEFAAKAKQDEKLASANSGNLLAEMINTQPNYPRRADGLPAVEGMEEVEALYLAPLRGSGLLWRDFSADYTEELTGGILLFWYQDEVNAGRLSAETVPLSNGLTGYAAAGVEQAVYDRFAIPAEALRQLAAGAWHPQSGGYIIPDGRGGGVPIIKAVAAAQDDAGDLLLRYEIYTPMDDLSADYYPVRMEGWGILTVHPTAEGGFTYMANRFYMDQMIFSIQTSTTVLPGEANATAPAEHLIYDQKELSEKPYRERATALTKGPNGLLQFYGRDEAGNMYAVQMDTPFQNPAENVMYNFTGAAYYAGAGTPKRIIAAGPMNSDPDMQALEIWSTDRYDTVPEEWRGVVLDLSDLLENGDRVLHLDLWLWDANTATLMVESEWHTLGFFTSTNGGAGWQQTGSIYLEGVTPSDILTSPVVLTDPQNIWVAPAKQEMGESPDATLWHSTDGGKHWQRHLVGHPQSPDLPVTYVFLSQNEGQIFLAAYSDDQTVLILWSDDGGASWHQTAKDPGRDGRGETENEGQTASDEELISAALRLSKRENNYTHWLFTPADGSGQSGKVIRIPVVHTHIGEEFTDLYEYAPVSEFGSMQDFLHKAGECLTAEYIENYLYPYLGLSARGNVPAPLLKEENGILYKQTTINGVSIWPDFDYLEGEVLRKTETTAKVRLYVDPAAGADIAYVDFGLAWEEGRWKHDPLAE